MAYVPFAPAAAVYLTWKRTRRRRRRRDDDDCEQFVLLVSPIGREGERRLFDTWGTDVG